MIILCRDGSVSRQPFKKNRSHSKTNNITPRFRSFLSSHTRRDFISTSASSLFSPLSVFLYPSPAGAPRSSSTFSLLFLPQCRARPRLRGPLQTPRTLGVVRVATVAESAKQPPRKKHKSRRARQWVIVTVIFHGRRTQSFCRNKIVVLVLGFEIPTMCPPVQLSSTHQ